mgnify:CR=1 FL=1
MSKGMNKKLISRLLIFIFGLPAVLAVVFIPGAHHLALHLLICVCSYVAANELYNIFSTKVKLYPRPFVLCCATVIPLVAAIYEIFIHERLDNTYGDSIMFGYPFILREGITFSMMVVFLLMLAMEVVTAKTFEQSLVRMAAGLFIVIYTGFLFSFVSRMTYMRWSNGIDSFRDASTPIIAVFLLMVFLCDSCAWFFGVLFGKNNRGFIKASPNKSIIGFIGGFVGSMGAGVLGYILWPWLFGLKREAVAISVVRIMAVGIVIAFAAIVGDLTESIFKRSAGVKDSGHIILGRGGLLDSVDSILMAAPIYYLLVSAFYGPFN